MKDQRFERDVFRDLLEEAGVVGQLAMDEESFLAAYEAFRAEDPKAFHEVLGRLHLLPQCRLLCEWIRSKECVFLCLELCGPPIAIDHPPSPRALAEAIVRITSDEKLVRELAHALEERDHEAFQRIVATHKLEHFSHLLCHWLCTVRYRLVCHWICNFKAGPRPDLAEELWSAGHALGLLLARKDAFEQAVVASNAGDFKQFGSVLRAFELFQHCHFICEWFCSWRCTFVCLTLCRQFSPVAIKQPLPEAHAFAIAVQQLLQRPADLERLSTAVEAGDAKAYAAIVVEFKLQRFCIQLCHWICSLRGRLTCHLVCPPWYLFPQFTSIGGYDYLVDIQSGLAGSGLTVGDNRAFFNTLRLNGILTQTLWGLPMEYRFETRSTDAAGNPTGPWTAVLPPQISRTVIGKWEHFRPIPIPTWETKNYTVNGIAGPNELVTTISPDGWIQVPQESNANLPSGAFSSNGNMIELISQFLRPFPAADETGVVAGGPAAHPLAQDAYFGIRMRVRQQGVPGSETDGGTCEHVAIDDTLYDNITLHPDWAGGLQAPGRLGVCMLDIAELIAQPCSQINNALTVLFTAAHPNLGSVSLVMTGPGGPFTFILPALPEPGDWFGTATFPPPPPPGWKVSQLTPCAYLVTLTVSLLLTNGDSSPGALIDQIAFCKK